MEARRPGVLHCGIWVAKSLTLTLELNQLDLHLPIVLQIITGLISDQLTEALERSCCHVVLQVGDAVSLCAAIHFGHPSGLHH